MLYLLGVGKSTNRICCVEKSQHAVSADVEVNQQVASGWERKVNNLYLLGRGKSTHCICRVEVNHHVVYVG